MAGKKKTKKKTGKKFRFVPPLLLFLVLAGTLAGLGYIIFLYPGTSRKTSLPKIATVHKKPPQIIYEEPIKADNTIHLITPSGYKETVTLPHQPLVAIIIDDMGYKTRIPNKLLDLDLDLTFSFLPHGPHTTEQMKKAAALGRDIMLHLPMEARDARWNPGPGGMFTPMDKNQLKNIFQEDLASVPLAVGVNNHMGSKFTADTNAMTTVLNFIREHNLFFVDSLTTANSVGWNLARKKGIKTAKRNVFLDNSRDREKTIIQIKALIRLARRQGSAVGIGHPYPATLAALESCRDILRKQVKVAPVHLLVK